MTLRCSAALLGVLLVLPAPSLAQRPMSIVDLISVPAVSTPQLSPDGRQVVFVQADTDWKANKRISHLWRVGIDGSDPTQLTSGADGESQPRWSPDGKWIAFVAKRGGAETAQIHLLPMEGGEAQPTDHPRHRRGHPGVVADGRSLFFLAEDPKSDEQKAREQAKDDVYAFDENIQHRHLWRIEVATRAETRVTLGTFSLLSTSCRPTDAAWRITALRAPGSATAIAAKCGSWMPTAATP